MQQVSKHSHSSRRNVLNVTLQPFNSFLIGKDCIPQAGEIVLEKYWNYWR
jgi:hypothetical protein